MPLMGALSNHADSLSRLGDLRQRLLIAARHEPKGVQKRKPRNGEIRDAIVKALAESAPEGLPTKEIIWAAESVLGKPVSRDTVDSCLSVWARGSRPLFVRVGPGRYRLA